MRRPYTESEIRDIVAEEVARYFDCLATEAALARIARKRRPVWPRVLRVLQRILRTA